MIEPKELMIGNLVHYKYLRSAPDEWAYADAVVSGIHENGFQFKKTIDTHSLIVELKYFDPIPLTPEWLERLGFEKEAPKNHWEEYWKHDFLRLYVTDGKVTPVGVIHSKKPKYVHQLQNLYHALAGQELTLKT